MFSGDTGPEYSDPVQPLGLLLAEGNTLQAAGEAGGAVWTRSPLKTTSEGHVTVRQAVRRTETQESK